MSNFTLDKKFLFGIFIYYFNAGKPVNEIRTILFDLYGNNILSEQLVDKWSDFLENSEESFKVNDEYIKRIEEGEFLEKNKVYNDCECEKIIESRFPSIYNKRPSKFKLSLIKENYRKIILHYKNIQSKAICINKHSLEYFEEKFKSLEQAKQISLYLIEKVKNGIIIFDKYKQIEILKIIRNLDILKRKRIEERKRKCIPSPNNLFFHYIIIHFFHLNQTAMASYNSLINMYGDEIPSLRMIMYKFQQFKNQNFEISGKKRVQSIAGRPTKFQDDQLKALINKNSTCTQLEIAKLLGVKQRIISHRLKKIGYIKKNGKWSLSIE